MRVISLFPQSVALEIYTSKTQQEGEKEKEREKEGLHKLTSEMNKSMIRQERD